MLALRGKHRIIYKTFKEVFIYNSMPNEAMKCKDKHSGGLGLGLAELGNIELYI